MRSKALSATKQDFIDAISHELNLKPYHVQRVLNHFLLKLIHHIEKKGRAEFRGLGIFEVVVRKQKIGRNPKNASKSIVIPEHSCVKFSPCKKLKTAVASEDR